MRRRRSRRRRRKRKRRRLCSVRKVLFLMVMTMKNAVFWDITPCSFVETYQYLGTTLSP